MLDCGARQPSADIRKYFPFTVTGKHSAGRLNGHRTSRCRPPCRVRDGARPRDPLLARAVDLIGTSKPLKPEAAIEKLTKNLREELAERIVDAGWVREEKGKVLGIFPTTRWPEVDGSHERAVRNELSAALLVGVTPTPRTAALVSLLSAVVAATVPVIVAGSGWGGGRTQRCCGVLWNTRDFARVEHMFDTGVLDRGVRETVSCLADTESDVGLVELMADLHRSESVVAERKLAVIAELFVRRTAEIESDGAWTSTAHEVVEAEIGAALTMGRAAAGRLIGLGMSLRTRLPATREAMARGDLDMYRVRLIEDATANVADDRIGEVEHQLLEQVLAPQRSGGTGLTGRRLTNAANRIIAKLDPAGVRAKREKAQADRFVGVSAAEDGMCRILGSIPAVQGRAFDARLRELANTVCPKDLRTYEQRRADGLSALVDGAGYVKCECGRADCTQDSRNVPTARKPLVHLIMLDSTLSGDDEPGLPRRLRNRRRRTRT
ncbi:DUF222 domain-containing protein [Rhodococcus opacus]|uniref:DUF222 domain-containing protein n=1 Tax=Rhodococcus opacus TaxID=37919 RepID=UPI0027DEBDCE|nr:DUF222 domain-containing protein [Rhodococcus opacus]